MTWLEHGGTVHQKYMATITPIHRVIPVLRNNVHEKAVAGLSFGRALPVAPDAACCSGICLHAGQNNGS